MVPSTSLAVAVQVNPVVTVTPVFGVMTIESTCGAVFSKTTDVVSTSEAPDGSVVVAVQVIVSPTLTKPLVMVRGFPVPRIVPLEDHEKVVVRVSLSSSDVVAVQVKSAVVTTLPNDDVMVIVSKLGIRLSIVMDVVSPAEPPFVSVAVAIH